jgi:hypothetical protein
MTVVVSIDDSVVATLSGSRFSGNITVAGTGSFEQGISGSLTQLVDGTSYLVAGENVTITSASNGQVTIAATDPAVVTASFVTLTANSMLTNERILTAGTDITLTDAGANSTATLGMSNDALSNKIIDSISMKNALWYDVQAGFSYSRFMYWYSLFGMARYGTETAGTIATTNVRTRTSRLRTAGAAAAESQAGLSIRTLKFYRQDGFFVCVTFAFETWAAARRQSFCGLCSTTTFPISDSTQPSALTDMVGVGMDSGDTALYIMHNDASGTATKVSTTYTVATTTMYTLILKCLPCGNIEYVFRNLGAGTEVSGALTTNLPTPLTDMFYHCVWNSGSTAASVVGNYEGMLFSQHYEVGGLSSF